MELFLCTSIGRDWHGVALIGIILVLLYFLQCPADDCRTMFRLRRRSGVTVIFNRTVFQFI